MSTGSAADGRSEISRSPVLKAFAVLAGITFLLRIFYAGNLYQDDGLWFAAAEELTRGKALYSQIYFDKPPVLPLVYAALFKIFGAHVLTIRLFTILYSLAVSFVLYLFGSRLYGRRAGLVAAAMFTFFSTTYEEGHFQGLNTDFLMTLPYAAASYFFVRSLSLAFGSKITRTSSYWFALAGGALTGIAFQINPKGILNLLFFALLVFIWRRRTGGSVGEGEMPGQEDVHLDAKLSSDALTLSPHLPFTPSPLLSLALAVAGFIAGALPFWIYIVATGSLADYRLYVWDWGARYANYFSAGQMLLSALRQSVDYFVLNSLLLITLAYVIVAVIRRAKRREADDPKVAPEAYSVADRVFRADATLLLWLAVSFAGLCIGGRFFGHYFFQILPALCLTGSRGLLGIIGSLKVSAHSIKAHEQKSLWRRAVFARPVVFGTLVAVFLVTLIRFHTRTAILAADWVRGSKSAQTSRWFHEELNREERMAAAVIKGMPDGEEAAGRVGLEAIRFYQEEGGRETAQASRYLFVWGYRPEIYFWTGLAPASRYLSTQPLTGVPADVHYFGNDFRSLLDESKTAEARAELLRDLERTQPEYIVDELAVFNSRLGMKSFPELRDFLESYKPLGVVGRFFLYRNKQFIRKYQQRHAQP